MKRFLCVLLAATLVFQLLPTALASSQPDQTQSELNPLEGYSFCLEAETNNTVIVSPPPTFIVDHDHTSIEEDALVPEESTLVPTEEPLPLDEPDSITVTSLEDEHPLPAFLTTPYLYDSSADERINLSSGALELEHTDYILPGINGLDLVIQRRYNSRDAALYELSFELQEYDDWGFEYLVGRHNYNYYNNMYQLGHGWSFCFPSVESSPYLDEYYLHLEDGRSIKFKHNPNNDSITLSRYNVHDITIAYFNAVIPNTTNHAKWKVIKLNGDILYFSEAGRLLWHEDRFGNRIKYTYSTENGYPKIEITDTLNRVVTISGQAGSNNSGHTMVVSLPDNNSIYYNIADFDSVGRGLASTTDSEGNTTYYSYTLQDAFTQINNYPINPSCDGENYTQYMNLTTITHPTGAQTAFSYQVGYDRLRGPETPDFPSEIYRIVSRRDIVAGNESDTKTFSYSNWFMVSPNSGLAQTGNELYHYTTTVTKADGVVEVAEFNDVHNLKAYIVSQNNLPIKETYYPLYSSWGFPTRKILTINHNQVGGSFIYGVRRDYTSSGLVQNEWPVFDTSNETAGLDYQVSYTYGDYGQLLTKEYMTDANTTVKLTNTLTSDSKNIYRSKVTVNGTLKQQTTFSYDAYGNVLSTLESITSSTNRYTAFTYQDNAYLATRRVASSTTAAGVTELTNTYDNLGRLITSTDAKGYTTTYTYNALGSVTRVDNPDGTSVQYNINYPGNYVTVVNELGDAVKYTYTPLGLEYETVDVQTGSVIQRKHYDEKSRLIREEEFINGSVTDYTYDSLDRVLTKTTKQGNVILAQESYIYDDAAENGTYQKVTKTVLGDSTAPSIVTTQYTDKMGFVAKTGQMLGGTEYLDTYTYNFVGDVLTVLTAADAARSLPYTTQYEYDGLGNATKIYNAEGQYTQNTYNRLGLLTKTIDYAGTPTTYTYNYRGFQTKQTITIEEGVTAATSYTYDNNGNLTQQTSPANAASGTTKVLYTYDNRNRLTKVRQYNGSTVALTTQYTYDGAGNLLTQTTGGKTTTYTYNRFGSILSMKDALNQMETYSYSPLGQLQSKQDRNGITTTYAYDALGRTVSVTAGSGSSADVLNYAYTLTGQIAMAENNTQRTSYEYDELGRPVTVNEWGRTSLESSIQVTLNPNGGEVIPTSLSVIPGDVWALPTPAREGFHFAGWFLGNTQILNGSTITQATNCTLIAHWDTAVTVTLDYNDGITESDVLTVNQGQSITLPSPTRVGYNFVSWRRWPDDHAAGSTVEIEDSCTFVAIWAPITYTIKFCNTVLFFPVQTETMQCTYDVPVTLAAGLNFTYNGGFLQGWQQAGTGTYYPFGSVVSNLTAVDGAEIVMYAVWSNGIHGTDPTEEQMESLPEEPLSPEAVTPVPDSSLAVQAAAATPVSLTYTKTYTYDLAGNRTSFLLTQGSTTLQNVSYTYDNLNRLSTVAKSGTTQASYTYDTNGNRATQTLANGDITTYTYNKANWVTNLVNKKGSTTISSFAYTYFPSGQQATKTDKAGVVTTYVYDGLGRLTQESEAGGLTVAYTFDSAGNRSSMAVTGSETYTVSYSYDANNRLTSSQYVGGGTTQSSLYTYDANGNLLTKSEWRPQDGLSSIASYSYNRFNQLTAQTVNGQNCAYAYNADGIRAAKAVGSTVTSYYLDGGNVVGEKIGTATTTYLRGLNLISKTKSSTTQYYLHNAHGDVVNLTNASGNSTKAYDYDAFGNEKNQVASDVNPFRYCGEYLDKETNEHYLRARYYDPSVGRFSQADTHWNPSNMIYGDTPQQIGEYKDALGLSRYAYLPQVAAVSQAGNLYVYCINNPILHFDKTGKQIENVLKETLGSYFGAHGDSGAIEIMALICLGVFKGIQRITSSLCNLMAKPRYFGSTNTICNKHESTSFQTDIKAIDTHHILYGSKNSRSGHMDGWKKFGLDPKRPDDENWLKLLPYLLETLQKDNLIETKTTQDGGTLFFYANDYVDLGIKVIVKVWKSASGELLQLSDAFFQYLP